MAGLLPVNVVAPLGSVERMPVPLVVWMILKLVRRTKPVTVSVDVSVATCVGAVTRA